MAQSPGHRLDQRGAVPALSVAGGSGRGDTSSRVDSSTATIRRRAREAPRGREEDGFGDARARAGVCGARVRAPVPARRRALSPARRRTRGARPVRGATRPADRAVGRAALPAREGHEGAAVAAARALPRAHRAQGGSRSAARSAAHQRLRALPRAALERLERQAGARGQGARRLGVQGARSRAGRHQHPRGLGLRVRRPRAYLGAARLLRPRRDRQGDARVAPLRRAARVLPGRRACGRRQVGQVLRAQPALPEPRAAHAPARAARQRLGGRGHRQLPDRLQHTEGELDPAPREAPRGHPPLLRRAVPARRHGRRRLHRARLQGPGGVPALRRSGGLGRVLEPEVRGARAVRVREQRQRLAVRQGGRALRDVPRGLPPVHPLRGGRGGAALVVQRGLRRLLLGRRVRRARQRQPHPRELLARRADPGRDPALPAPELERRRSERGGSERVGATRSGVRALQERARDRSLASAQERRGRRSCSAAHPPAYFASLL